MKEKKFILKGKAHVFGDDVNTDEIISAKYLNTTDGKELGKHCLEDKKDNFQKNLKNADMIIAGKNFGCGSSREHAPLAIKGCGVSCVIAKSFARIFFRNSINIGLPILECQKIKRIKQNDLLEVDLDKGLIKNITKNETYATQPFPDFIKQLINKGGLLATLKKGK